VIKGKNGLQCAVYEAVKSDPQKSQIIEELEDKISDLKGEIEAARLKYEDSLFDLEQENDKLIGALNNIVGLAGEYL